MLFLEIYKIGMGPSSSHTMGPRKAAEQFAARVISKASRVEVHLYGSLAATGKGHLTDQAVIEGLAGLNTEILWHGEEFLPLHPNGMTFHAYDDADHLLDSWTVYSIGGGNLLPANGDSTPAATQPSCPMAMDVLRQCREKKQTFWQYVEQQEGPQLWQRLEEVWDVMLQAVQHGLATDQPRLPGSLNLRRRAVGMLARANDNVGFIRDLNLVSSYALAVAEENAAGGMIVTAPTCGSAGVLPATLYYFHKHLGINRKKLLRALATAALFGTIVARHASISGAEVGCQGEIGTACAMASAAVAQLQGGSLQQIEYAAEMGMEHWLGLTCDPIDGLVQVPCIERNAFAAMRAMECAAYALATDGTHLVNFDNVVEVMYNTGKDLQCKYRETAAGGLAKIMHDQLHKS